jgi:hypothetical protein
MVVANNVQTRSNGVDNQVNPWSPDIEPQERHGRGDPQVGGGFP